MIDFGPEPDWDNLRCSICDDKPVTLVARGVPYCDAHGPADDVEGSDHD